MSRKREKLKIIVTKKTMRIRDRKSTRLNSSHDQISYAVFCLKKKKNIRPFTNPHFNVLLRDAYAGDSVAQRTERRHQILLLDDCQVQQRAHRIAHRAAL